MNEERIEETFSVHWGKKNDAKLKLKLARKKDHSPFHYRISFEIYISSIGYIRGYESYDIIDMAKVRGSKS